STFGTQLAANYCIPSQVKAAVLPVSPFTQPSGCWPAALMMAVYIFGTQLTENCFVHSADRAARLLAWCSILRGVYLPGVALTGRSFCGTRKTAHYPVCSRGIAIPSRASVLSQPDAC